MERDFALRLSNKGMDKVRAEWKAFGNESSGAVNTLNAASMKVTPSLKAVDDAAMGVKRTFEQWAGQIPVIGGFLQSVGPWGLAAGAGLTALGAGLVGFDRTARQAIEEVGALKDMADTLMISAENLQGLRNEILLAGVKAEVADKAMQTLAINSARASEGFGKMKAALEKVNPELGRALAATETQSERFKILARGISEAATENEKLNIATAAFGGDGAQMIRVVDQAGASLESFAAKARAAGVVLSEETVTRIEELGDEIAALQAKQKVAEQRMALAYAPAIKKTEEAKLTFINALTDLGEMHKRLEEQDEGFIRRQMANAQRMSQTAVDFLRARFAAEASMYQAELDRRAAELDRQDRSSAASRSRAIASSNSAWADFVTGNRAAEVAAQKAAADKAALDAARRASEALREQQAEERAALALRAAAQTRWLAVIDASKSPVQQLQERIRALQDDERAGLVTADQYRQVRALLNEELRAAVEAAKPVAEAMSQVTRNYQEARTETFQTAFAMEGLNAVFNEQMRTLEDLEDVALYTFKRIALGAIDAASQVKGASLGDYFNALLGAFGFGGGGSSPSVDASWAAYPTLNVDPSIAAYQMHGGGEVGDASMTRRMAPRAAMIRAPRFHNGFAPDEFPTVLQQGERVFSARHNERIVRAVERGGSGGGGNMTVNIHPPSGYQAETRETQGADGGRSLEVTFTRMVKGIVASGGIDREMGQRYGVKTQVGA